MRDDWALDLLAHIAKQAIRDYRAGYRHQGVMDAATWLKLAGLMLEDGTLDTRGVPQQREEEQVA
jgi:hypothetical protein